MNLDAETIALSQIQYLVTSLNKKNYKSSVSDCFNLVDKFGLECERHLLRTLFSLPEVATTGNAKTTSLQLQFLTRYCEGLFSRPNLVSLVCFAFEQAFIQSNLSRATTNPINQFAKNLQFSPIRCIAFACALKHSSLPNINRLSDQYILDCLPTFVQNFQASQSKISYLELDKNPGILHFVLTELQESKFRSTIIDQLDLIYQEKPIPLLLAPLVHIHEKVKFHISEDEDPSSNSEVVHLLTSTLREENLTFQDLVSENLESNTMVMTKAHLDTVLPEMVRELGYQFTSSHETCRLHLRQFIGAGGSSDLHAATIARILGVMARTHTGLDDSGSLQQLNATGTSLWEKGKDNELKTWNIDIFIKVVHEMQPTLNWKEIVYELDHPGFAIKDRQGLMLLMKSLKLGFNYQGFSGPFPIDIFYTLWKNSDGLVTIYQQILMNPDYFNFFDHPFRPVVMDMLKVQPDDNRDLASWRSLDVTDTLLALAEAGHTHAVKELFAIPQAHCPDVLTVALIQTRAPMTNFRTDLLIQTLQVFFGNHPNSAVIMHYAWNTNSGLRFIVMHAMSEWYSKAVQEGDTEHSRLSRILEVAQDIKALPCLLPIKPTYFIVDLAVLASRREYLNLEKWLTDQMRDNGEHLVKTVVSYLQRKLPNIHGPGPLKEEHLSKVSFHGESLGTILLFLQSVASSAPMHSDLKEHIANMWHNSQSLLTKLARPQPPIPAQQANIPPVPRPAGTRPMGSLPDAAMRATPKSFYQSGGNAALDQLANMTGQMNLSGASSNSSFSLGGSAALGQIVSGSGSAVLAPPGSPSRMFGGPIPPTGSSMDNPNGGTSSPFHPVIPNPSPATVSQPSSTSIANLEQIRQGISNISNLFPEISGPIAREVEDEANTYFQRIYNHPPHPTLTIDEVLEYLKKFQESNNQRERDVFTCMIKNLFEEYKYFPQYPEKELHITAQLFGGIIEHGLVNMIPLGLALRFVLDAVRKPPDSKMYYFGIAALDRFKTRLKDYPQYCQHVSCIPHFKEFPPHLVDWVEFGSQSHVPPTKPQGPVLPQHLEAIVKGVAPPALPSGPAVPSVVSAPPPAVAKPQSAVGQANTSAIVRPTAINGRPSIANTTNIDTLVNARVKAGISDNSVAPSDTVQDRVAFIFNNLSLMNMQQKSDDLLETLNAESKGEDNKFSSWLANYLVLKRVTIEPNFHNLYANFLEVLHNEFLYSEVLKDTYTNIRFLLTNDKSIANFSDRSLLKNLGHWLGLITLARNKPILMVDVDIKPLIIEAHQISQQELMYVVPFVAKVLESCAKSKVFKPPSPWTMGIMNLLAELHQENELKLNLKFEIEVLCKNLNIELSTLRPGNLLSKQLQIRSFGLKSQTPPVSNQMSGQIHQKGSMADSFGMMHSSAMGQRKLEQSLQHHPGNQEHLHIPGNMVMNSGGMHGFGGTGVNSVPSSSAPGTGLGGALMQAPVQQTMPSGFVNMSQSPMSQHSDLSAGSSIGGLDAQAAALVVADSQTGIMRPPEPKFHYTDISTSGLNGIVPHISINSGLNLMKEQPDFAQFIKIAIEKSIQDVASPVIDRAVKIALTTCEQLVKKDFALDHDENRVRQAAHHMVRNLTAGMAMITCRDHLHLAIKNHFKNLIVTLGRNMTPQQQESIDMTVSVIANDNVELACAFIQKKGIERAILEMDKRLKNEYEARIMSRKEGRPYCDAVTLTYQAERMPEPIRLKMGGVTAQQNAVYDEFARNIPGFKVLSERETLQIAPKPILAETGGHMPMGQQPAQVPIPIAPVESSRQLVPTEECIAILDEVQSKIEPFVQTCNLLPATPHMSNLHSLLEALSNVRNNKDIGSIMQLIHKAIISLLEGLTPHLQVDTESLARYRDANLLVLRALGDTRAFGMPWVSTRVTACLLDVRDDLKYNLDAVDTLFKSGLVALFEFDKHLAQAMANGDNVIATAFAMQLCKVYLMDERTNASVIESDLFGTIEVLQRISTQSPRPPEGLVHLMERLRYQTEANFPDMKMSSERLDQNLNMSGPTAQLHSGIAQAREFEDPQGLLEKTEYLLREWVNAYHSRDAGKDSRQAFVVFVQLMNQHGILKTDDLITRFFRMSTQMCVDLCYRALSEPNNSPTLVRAKCFHTLDAYVRLITLLVKHSGETQNTITKVNLLNKVLGTVAGVLLIDHDIRQSSFQQVPYHRIFIMLFLELTSPDPILETISFQVLTAYCNMLHILRPAKATGFAFAWLEIVSHRVFMGRILQQTPGQKGWPLYAALLVDLFKFLSPFLRNAELGKPVQKLYRGALRVLLVLLHDFPEFLCDYHYGFCDVIPPNCIQLRNLILSAFPRNMRLPDPFTPNLKVDNLPEISIAPRAVSNYAALIKPTFKKDLDSYLKNRAPVGFLSELRSNLLVASSVMADTPPGNKYNIQLINALVMYVGTSAIQYIRSKGLTPNMSTIAHSSHMDIFQNLAVDLETEGRYLFLNCIANQLRYPNSHTHYFSCTLLYLFAEANQEAIQEQITRVLLERLIVNRPHPWGLLITFIELIKNSTYNFWKHEFVHCAPEIQKLFESVARSCMVSAVPRMDMDGPMAD